MPRGKSEKKLTYPVAMERFNEHLANPNSDLSSATIQKLLSDIDSAIKNSFGTGEDASAYCAATMLFAAGRAASVVIEAGEHATTEAERAEVRATLEVLHAIAPDLETVVKAIQAVNNVAVAAEQPLPDVAEMNAPKGGNKTNPPQVEPPTEPPAK